jgi:HSP20 family protein
MFNLIPWKKKSDGKLGLWREDAQYAPLAQFRSEFDSLMDRFWSDWGAMKGWGGDWRVGFRDDWQDTPSEYVFHAELPGFEEDEIDVKVSGNSMSVHAEHKEENRGEESSSFRYGAYHRAFTLPYGVDEEKIDARYRNGILEVHLPKTEQAKGKRIPVIAA